DAPLMPDKSAGAMRQAARETGRLQGLSHIGGEFERRADGSILGYERHDGGGGGETNQYYRDFGSEMRGIGDDGYFSYELCNQLPVEKGQAVGIEFANRNVELAAEFMREIFKSCAEEQVEEEKTERTETAAAK